MRTIIILIFLSVFVSCKKQIDYEANDVILEGMLYELGNDLNKDCEDLKKSIADKEYESEILSNQRYNSYKNTTLEYIKYLEELDSLSVKNESNPFFEGDTIPESKNFIKISNDYINDINEIVSNKNLKIGRAHV